MGVREVGDAFHVSVHDVEPGSMDAVERILAALRPVIGERLSLAVIPCRDGREVTHGDARVRRAASRADEVLLHGWTHRREQRPGLVSLVTGGADEFAGLSEDEALARLSRGRDLLESVLERPVRGFLAPAFRRGRVDASLATRAGLSFVVGWRGLLRRDAPAVPLATTFWDLTAAGWGSRLGELGGRVAGWRPGAVPVVAVHPADVHRGRLPRAVALVRELVAAGRRPVRMGALALPGGAR